MIRNQEVDDDKEAIIRQYSTEDKSTVELAEEYNVAPNTIRNRPKEWDADIRSVGQRYGWLDDCLDSIVEQYVEQGDSLQTIADQYGTTTSPIKNGFRKQASNFVPPTIRSLTSRFLSFKGNCLAMDVSIVVTRRLVSSS